MKDVLHRYLQTSREALVWKLEGLPERELRLPRTPTGTNLLGLVKHMANVEAGYFCATFGRPCPAPDELVEESAFDTDPQADFYALATESSAGIVDLYRRVWAAADATIAALPLDAPGEVPWWPEERRAVTLGQVMVHVLTDLTRHAGHADILREEIDGSAGLRAASSNVPAGVDWPAYVAKLTALADGA
ncbi:DinB family protein [Nocardioides jejuensis]|uniref:DinB family protein n=1 Tax=Nocardioides jejuensis TaxID=2502782 RepID=A0A4V2P016_9ACTN|nr:DinB family protein [Nocardioides jejuensis]TCJ31202.1 DinB family protein [Nocardioides jejuensis]